MFVRVCVAGLESGMGCGGMSEKLVICYTGFRRQTCFPEFSLGDLCVLRIRFVAHDLTVLILWLNCFKISLKSYEPFIRFTHIYSVLSIYQTLLH